MKHTVYFLSTALILTLAACRPQQEIAPLADSGSRSVAARSAAPQSTAKAFLYDPAQQATKLSALILLYRGIDYLATDPSLTSTALAKAREWATTSWPLENKDNWGRGWYVYQGILSAEGNYDPVRVIEAWLADPKKKAILLDKKYTRFGVGYCERSEVSTPIFAVTFEGGDHVVAPTYAPSTSPSTTSPSHGIGPAYEDRNPRDRYGYK